MRKITLDPDNLRVESFATGASGANRRTVLGFDASQYQVCKKYPGGDSNMDPTCEPGLTNDEPSCAMFDTCNATCATCIETCGYSCGMHGDPGLSICALCTF